MKGLHIVATGHYAPEKIVTNEDLSKVIDTSDEWITARTGMKRRHFCKPEENNVSMAVIAAKKALEKTKISPEEIGVLIVATFSGDYLVPSAACMVQKELGLSDEMICFDLSAACSGFIFGMETIRGLLAGSEKKYGILIGSECISRRLDMTDRGSCILFGDGAGAAIFTLEEGKSYTSNIGCHGDAELIYCKNPADLPGKVHMEGQATYKFAVGTVPKLLKNTAEKAGLALEEIDLFILHQANERIIDAVAKHLKLPKERFFKNIEEFANTSAASVAIALSDAMERGSCKPGQKVMLAGFGAGKTWGAIVLDI